MIIFTPHSEEKLHQRKLKRLQVIEVLRQPDKTVKSYGDRIIALKKLGKLYLKVIYKREGKNIIVITQHWVEKI